MTIPRIARFGALLAATCLTAAAPAAAAPKVCPDVYAPVCAVTPNGMNETFTNGCFARMAHARILHAGRCIGRICFFIVNPVCARVPGHKPQTYPNLCAAENAHATLLHNGACK